MTHRSTSKRALRAVTESGTLESRNRAVQRAFERYGPGTSGEVLRAAGLAKNLNLMRSRVTELGDAGILIEVMTRKCKSTGRPCIEWRYVEKDRVPRVKKNPKADAIEGLCATIERLLDGHATMKPGDVVGIRQQIEAARRLVLKKKPRSKKTQRSDDDNGNPA